jgi:hypothetical protein
MNQARVELLWPCAATRTSTLTLTPAGAVPTENQKVCEPVESAWAVFFRSPASKCVTTVILAPGAVDTWTPTLVPVTGRRFVTEAVLVSGGGGGAGVGDAVGEAPVFVAMGAG